MGLYDDLYPPIADRSSLVDGSPGVEIYRDIAPAPDEHVIKKHRYSAFFATDMDLILREWGVTSVVISGTTTENCCHATARDAMFHNYRVAFLSDATGTFDYPDVGWGAMSAVEVHKATLTILAFSTAHVMTVDEFRTLAGAQKERPVQALAACGAPALVDSPETSFRHHGDCVGSPAAGLHRLNSLSNNSAGIESE